MLSRATHFMSLRAQRGAISRKGILVIKLRNRLIILFLLFINIFIII